jgi:hypothetical protein
MDFGDDVIRQLFGDEHWHPDHDKLHWTCKVGLIVAAIALAVLGVICV